MAILSTWRKVRATVMRKECEDVLARAPCAKVPARFDFLNSVIQTHGQMLSLYAAASPSERRAILRVAKKAAFNMWDRGAWPSALGFAITCLNVESRFVPGADAAYVKCETDKIVEEALQMQVLTVGLDRPQERGPIKNDTELVTPRRGRTGRDHLRRLAFEARQIKQAALQATLDQFWARSGGERLHPRLGGEGPGN